MTVSVVEFVVIPYFTSIAYIALYPSRARILERLRKSDSPNVRAWLPILQNFKLKVWRWECTFLLFPAAVIGADLFLAALYGRPLRSYGFPLVVEAATSGFAAPVFESIVSQGFFIGLPLTLAEQVSVARNWRPERRRRALLLVAGCATVLSALFTAVQHPPPANVIGTFEFTTRFAGFLLFGGFYLASGRSLLPPIIAHAAGNWFLVLTNLPGGAR